MGNTEQTAKKRSKSLAPRARGRPRSYGPEELRRAAEKYFRRLGRTRAVTAPEATGELDKYGHEITVQTPVLGDDGQPLTEWQWVRPPSVGGLCAALGVNRSTFERWAAAPDYAPVVEWARDVIHGYLDGELLTREGKNTRGVEFMLSACFNTSEVRKVEISGGAAPDIAGMSDDELKQIIARGDSET